MNDKARVLAQLTERAKRLGREGSTEPEAIGINTAIIELNSTRYGAYIRRGICYQKQCLADEAERDFRKALELSPGNRIASDRLKEVMKLKTEIEALKNKQRADSLKLQSSIASMQSLPPTSDYYDFSVGWREETPLHRLGYKITGRSRHQRWQILVNRAVPQLGILEVSHTIANNCRLRKLQYDSEERFAHAIGEWEHDLARLKELFYDGSFFWPSTEIE
ncbi:MAG: tetratricopeptide repeat protein [Rubrobacter sp.]|nr:tetratricopeptide repeat protein [Rubrobacter sp.]